MTVIGFHCSHEQINPAQLLRDVQQAEQAGFTAAMSSDHFSPWSARQGESGFACSFLGAALASTTLPFGVVNAPGQRYHPAIIGQAIVTLAQMFPGRFWAALGSGVASNERVTGGVRPRKEVRDQRLVECVTIIPRLLHGEEVSHEGLVHVNRARLWTLPEIVPDLVGPAVTPETAARHAAWADGLITVNQPQDTLQHSASMYCRSCHQPPHRRGRRSHEAQRHRRPVVEKRRFLLRRRGDLLRLERRRLRRHPRHDGTHRVSLRPWRDVPVADALLPDRPQRRRLRHHRLLRCRPTPRDPRRLRRTRAHRQSDRNTGHHRLRHEPHVRRPPVVQVRPPQQGRPLPRLLRVERDQAEVEPSKKDVVFPDQENSLWDRDPKTNECYLHHFYKHQPDLNVANPKVQEEISRTLGFWLELGVSGFRVVAVPFLFAKDVRRRLPSMLCSDQRRMRMAYSL